MKQHRQTTVRVTGVGESKQRAFAVALNSVQREILKQNNAILLRIEPIDVDVVSAMRKTTVEKFLFFFLPRKKEQFTVVLDVSVDIHYVDVEPVDFTPTN